jgi:hypothetical protein
MAALLPQMTIETTGDSTMRDWRVWLDDFEVTHYLTDIGIQAGISEATQVTLTCRVRLRTLASTVPADGATR